MRVRGILLLLFIGLLLVSCSNDSKVVKDAKEMSNEKEVKQEVEKQKEKEQEEFYEEIAVPIEESLSQTEKDKMSLVTNDYENKEQYNDELEFAKYVSKQIFDFYNLQLTPEEYYTFIKNHGAADLKSELEFINNEEEAILFFTNVQGLLKDQKMISTKYEITEVNLNSGRSEGFFYRREQLAQAQPAYYITTIVKEGEFWKYLDDSTAPPFEEIEFTN